ncbi:MAG: hypothetical protein H2039_00825 [Brevundimonas sp.]|jgi:hypothetical protein|nr:hypothetical protein [Brevundimonas sp.]
MTDATADLPGTENQPFGAEEIAAAEGATARDAALVVLNWAKTHRLFGRPAMEDSAEAVDEDPQLEPQQLFAANAVQEVFRRRAINLIGFNEFDKKVVVFTKGKLTAAEQKLVPFQAIPGYTIEYVTGGLADVKGSPPPPQRHYPYALRNGKYTCGSSVYPADCIGAGTLGALTRKPDGKLFGLTNNHVTGACNNAQPGLPILAPGPLDVSNEHCDPFTIGRHSQLLPINDGIPENIKIDLNVDAACFEITDQAAVSSYQGDAFDTPAEVGTPRPGMKVEKIGRTTGHTTGVIIAQAVSPVPVAYAVQEYNVRKTVFFDNVFVVHSTTAEPFSKAGDSGSLIVQTDPDGVKRAVGLLFAGNPRTGETFILPLAEVLKKLDLNLVSGHNV